MNERSAPLAFRAPVNKMPSWLQRLLAKQLGLLAGDAFTEIEMRGSAAGGSMQGLHYLGRQAALSDCLFMLAPSARADTSIIRATPYSLLGFLARRRLLREAPPKGVRRIVDLFGGASLPSDAELFTPWVRAVLPLFDATNAEPQSMAEQVRITTSYEDFDMYYEHMLRPSLAAGVCPAVAVADKAQLWRLIRRGARLLLVLRDGEPRACFFLRVERNAPDMLIAEHFALLRPLHFDTAARQEVMRLATLLLQDYAIAHAFNCIDLGLTHNDPRSADFQRKQAVGATMQRDANSPRFAVIHSA